MPPRMFTGSPAHDADSPRKERAGVGIVVDAERRAAEFEGRGVLQKKSRRSG